MPDEIKNVTPPEPTTVPPEEKTPPIDEYLKELNELRANSVPRSEYDKLKEDNKKLWKSVIEGEKVENPNAKKEDVIDTEALAKELYGEEKTFSACDYIEKTLKLREGLIKQGKPDPFLPIGNNIQPTEEDMKKAQNVADVYRQCLDYAQGDSQAFVNELQRRTVNDAPIMGAKYNTRRN